MGEAAERTSSNVPDVLNARCVVPDPDRAVEPVVADRTGFVPFVRTWEAAVGRMKGGCMRSSEKWAIDQADMSW